jgi:DNA polymerase
VGEFSVEEICKIMSVNPKWAKGLPLDADGFSCDFYQKD